MPPIEKNTQPSTGAAPKKRKAAKKTRMILLDALSKRQHEILGAGIMLLSLLLLVAIVAYSPDDDSVIENVALLEFFLKLANWQYRACATRLAFLVPNYQAFWCRWFWAIQRSS